MPAVRLAFDERRAFPAAGPREGALRGLVHREHVVAVDGDAVEAVSACAVSDVVDRHALLDRHRVRVLIVLADEEDRQLLDAEIGRAHV